MTYVPASSSGFVVAAARIVPAPTTNRVRLSTPNRLQVLLPGETAAPGTSTGKTGSPTAQVAGTSLTITVNVTDGGWNVLTSLTDTVAITSNDANATLPSNAALVAGTKTFSVTLNTAGSFTVTATDVTNASVAVGISASVVNAAAAFSKLQILMPGETASPGSSTGKTGTPNPQTAGATVAPTVNAVDLKWNVVTSVTDTVGLTSTDANASLPSNTALVSGTIQLSMSFKTAGSRTVTATDITDGAKTANTSPSVTVNVGAFVKLQLLMLGETAAAGTATGKTGTPTGAAAGTPDTMTVNGVDANFNVVTTTADTIAITSSDGTATLPSNAALVSGTKAFSITFNAGGSFTVTATDATDGSKTLSTSPSITVTSGAWALVNHAEAENTNINGFATYSTSPAVDTTGADLVVAAVGIVKASGQIATFIDAYGNTYVEKTRRAATLVQASWWVCEVPTVGGSHTWTITSGGTPTYSALAASAWSGSKGSGSADQNTGNTTASATHLATSALTPSEANELVLNALCFPFAGQLANLTINSGFGTIYGIDGSANSIGVAWASKVTGSATTPDFDWTASGSQEGAVSTQSFKHV